MLGCGMDQTGRGKRFRGRPDKYRRLLGPGDRLLTVAIAAGKMQDLFALVPDTDGSAQLAELVKIRREEIAETVKVHKIRCRPVSPLGRGLSLPIAGKICP